MILRPIHLLFAMSLSTALWLALVARASALPTDQPKPPDIDPAVLAAEQSRIAAAAKAIPSVLCIFSPGGQGGGSGVVISPDGYALTNFHVAKPCGTFMKCGMADGKLYVAVIVGLDPVGDVALIKLYGRDDFPDAELADSDDVRVGDGCFTMGNPFLLATDFHPSVAYGIVSGVHRYQYPAGTLLEYTDCLQVDAAINPGNSGGPLFDAQGRLLGINGRGSFEKRGRVNVGVGYAISINQIKNFLGNLKAGRIVDHATLGARVSTSEDGRVLVSDILENSDAYRRGLRYDDEIVSFAGRPIRSVNAQKNVLGIFPKGWRVQLTYRRDGENHDTFVRLMGVHTDMELLAKVEGRLPGEMPPRPRRPKNKPGEEPKPDEKKPAPDKSLKEAVRSPVPEELKKQFEARPGYANYYFNRQNVQRIWNAWKAHGDFSKLTGAWTITGQAGADQQVVLRLDNSQGEIELPTGDSKIAVADGVIDSVLNPPGSGGFLPAVYLWRKLLTGGPGRFGQITYEGAAPLPHYEGLFDVLHAVGDGVETRFYCDPSDGQLVCLEMFPDDGADPCEVYFSDYRENDGRLLPHRMEVRYENNLFGIFTLTNFDLQKSQPAAH